jgi:hypothetical protein
VPQADSAQAFALSSLERILPTVVRPARYTGNEWNSVVKDWAGRLRVALIYPDVYEEGVCDPRVQAVYAALNSEDDILCERAFLPWADMDEAMRAAGVPLYGLESKQPIAAYDVVLVLVPGELHAPAVLTALDLADLLRRREVGDEPGEPLVVGIGAGVANPEPLAAYFDGFVAGDVSGERLRQMVHALRAADALVPHWLYLPHDGRPRGASAHDDALPPLVVRPIVPFAESKRERACIEMAHVSGPGGDGPAGREHKPDDILAAVEAALISTGYDHVHLSGPHSQLADIVERLSARYGEAHVHFTLDVPAVTAEVVDIADRLPRLTRAPLTINLAHTHGDSLLATARLAFQRGWRILKLAVCIGQPNETMADIEAVVATARRVRGIGREEINGQAQVQVIATPFIPRVGDADGAGLIVGEEWERRLDALNRGIRGPGLRLQWRGLETRQAAASLARGERSLGAVIEAAWRGGMRRPDDAHDAAAWQAAFSAAGIDLQPPIVNRQS